MHERIRWINVVLQPTLRATRATRHGASRLTIDGMPGPADTGRAPSWLRRDVMYDYGMQGHE